MIKEIKGKIKELEEIAKEKREYYQTVVKPVFICAYGIPLAHIIMHSTADIRYFIESHTPNFFYRIRDSYAKLAEKKQG